MHARRRKVGILTFHKCINYGSYWQARCLVEGIRARGHHAELLDHACRCVERAEMRCALQPKLPERTPPHEVKAYAAKTRKFIKAIAALPLSRTFSLHDPGSADEYDTIVIGSDEVWNFRHPWYGSKPIFFGDGLRTKRLVAYAASFGNHSAWDGIHPNWASKLGRFSALSVRDCNSWHLVRGSTIREPQLVLDPCLLFPEEARVRGEKAEPYALVYGHDFPDWLAALARSWANDRGIRLLSVGYSNDFAHEQRVSASPDDFAQLMSSAQAIITNFFHGCVFALLNGKPWATVPSDYRSIKIPDLASMLGAEGRVADEQTSAPQFAEMLNTPVTPQEAERVNDYRARSEAYLDEALR